MSERQRKLKQAESSVAAGRKTESAVAHRADLPRRAEPSGLAAAPNRLWQAGNRASNWLVGRLLGRRDGGQPLAQQTRAEMERSFDADFSDVRVHQDSSAQAAADSLNATAFARGDDIYLGAESPAPESPAGRELIAHELAHVAQQRRATELRAEVSQPGDRFEQAADRAARQALQGQAAESVVGGATPAIHRREKQGKPGTRAEAEDALRRYFEREMNAQGRKKDLQVTQQVKDAVQILFSEDPFGWLKIQSELNRFDLRMPGELASALAQYLPDTIAPGLLARIERLPARKKTPGLFGRVRGLVKQTKPGKAERPEPKSEPGSQKRFEQFMKQSQAARGGETKEEEDMKQSQAARGGETKEREQGSETKERRFPPSPFPFPPKVDALRAGRIIRGLPGAIRGPRPTGKTEPEARNYPEVERVIEQIASDALIPAEARGAEAAGEFADAREFAREVARRLDVARQQSRESIQLRLGDNYNSVRDRVAMITEINRIIQLFRDALPHHAANVKYVDVFFGEKLVTRGMARRAEGRV
ncbi:MAG: DUF4157 domain-containing protein [Blastocatellia bacterium]